jgi:hypothetical protein
MMNDRGGFSSGFILGSIIGGVVGGVVGTLVANRVKDLDEEMELMNLPEAEPQERRSRRSKRRLRSIDRIEQTRRSLDDKIAELNGAIDAVRSSIGNMPPSANGEAIVDASLEDNQQS